MWLRFEFGFGVGVGFGGIAVRSNASSRSLYLCSVAGEEAEIFCERTVRVDFEAVDGERRLSAMLFGWWW